MQHLPRSFRILIPAAVILSLGGAGGAWYHSIVTPKKFGVVESGRLYRCGKITPLQLERVAREHGIRTVLSLLDPTHPDSIAEREAAERLGLRWLNVPLSGDGSSRPEDRDSIREIVLDQSLAPLLVHCAAGANRTGLTCGMYRIHHDGWSYEQVLDEMRSYGFDDLEKHENLREALRLEAGRRATTIGNIATEK